MKGFNIWKRIGILILAVMLLGNTSPEILNIQAKETYNEIASLDTVVSDSFSSLVQAAEDRPEAEQGLEVSAPEAAEQERTVSRPEAEQESEVSTTEAAEQESEEGTSEDGLVSIHFHFNGGSVKPAETDSILASAPVQTGSQGMTFNAKPGTVIADYLDQLPTLKRDGYKFMGWFTEQKLGNGQEIHAESTMRADEDIIIYAQWKARKYDITYKLDGGTNSEANPVSYKISQASRVLEAAVKKGYTFKGWYLDSSFQQQITGLTQGETWGDLTLYAQFSPNTYYIQFMPNGAEGTMETMTCTYGEKYQVPACEFTPEKGYMLKEWNTKPDGSGKTVKDLGKFRNLTSVPDKIGKLFAIWEKEYIRNITFKANGGGGSMSSVKLKGKEKLPNINYYAPACKCFKGWCLDSKGKGTIYSNKELVCNLATDEKKITLYAIWESTESRIIKLLKKAGFTKAGIAAVIGNMYVESQMEVRIRQGYSLKSTGSLAEYQRNVDSGAVSKNSFVYNRRGYGLCQWTYSSRKRGLYNYARDNGLSIGSPEAQAGYMIKELKRDFSGLYNLLRSSSYRSSYDYLTRQFMRRYEAPASPNTTKRVRKARSVYYSL